MTVTKICPKILQLSFFGNVTFKTSFLRFGFTGNINCYVKIPDYNNLFQFLLSLLMINNLFLKRIYIYL